MPIPPYQAFALPFHRDKQLSQPTPIAYYIMTYAQYPHGHIFAYRYNTPWHGRFVAISSDGFIVAKFDMIEDSVQKTSFFLLFNETFCKNKSTTCDTCKARNPLCLDPPIPLGWLNRLQNYNIFLNHANYMYILLHFSILQIRRCYLIEVLNK